MRDLGTIVLGFLLTGLIGNWLVQSWQQRSWLKQQRFLGEEKEYVALKQLWDEIVELSGARLTRMRRLSSVVRRGDIETVRSRLSDYDGSVLRWNEKFQSFQVRLLRYTSGSALAFSLENQIQPQFVTCGRQLELLVNDRIAGQTIERKSVVSATHNLDRLSHALTIFNRDVLRVVQAQKTRTYEGVKIELGPQTVSEFRNWELFKALFHFRVEPYYVIRPSFDLVLPDDRRR
ncbi:MAG: hypothetical protein JWN16_1029 [Alphaproteobacteria bacterium]|nr:hypothetical protein [Alphaproteobacteria bacterium]